MIGILHEPMSGTNERTGLPIIVVALVERDAVCIEDDGQLRVTPLTEIRVDLRWNGRHWVDVSPGALDGAEK